MRGTAGIAASLSFCAGLLCACVRDPAPDGTGGSGGRMPEAEGRLESAAEARIYAAASLTDAIRSVAHEFEALRGGRVVPSFGASGTLALQLREGAAPGVFVAAGTEWADELHRWGLVEEGSRVELLGNSLVAVVPAGARERPVRLEDLSDARFPRIALADTEAVPAGRYARAALENAGVFESLRGRVVAGQDVRTALSYVERGEVPVGIVYATDAAGNPRVDVAVRVPSALHPEIRYPMVLVKGASRADRALHEFLRSETARSAFERAGFTRP